MEAVQQLKPGKGSAADEFDRHGLKLLEGLLKGALAKDVVFKVPERSAEHGEGEHAEKRVKKYTNAEQRRLRLLQDRERQPDPQDRPSGSQDRLMTSDDRALLASLSEMSLPAGTKVPCFGCYEAFKREFGITLESGPGEFFVNDASSLISFGSKIIPVGSAKDKLVAKMAPSLVAVLKDVGRTVASETVMHDGKITRPRSNVVASATEPDSDQEQQVRRRKSRKVIEDERKQRELSMAKC